MAILCTGFLEGVAVSSTRAGQVLADRYRLLDELGSGGFGRVWRARDERLHLEVAIKELWLAPGMPEAERTERLTRAAREARNAAQLRNHENIVTIHDVIEQDGLPWIVLELIDGCSLAEHLRAHGPLSVDRTAQIAIALLRAIEAANQRQILHRDIKPANVMLARDGTVLLTDFGTAVHSADSALTDTGVLVGSAEYLAPERWRGAEASLASDLFSLGATLYQAVEGVSPFRRETRPATLAAVMQAQAPAPRRAGRLTSLITLLLEKDPHRRPTVDQALTMARGVQLAEADDPTEAAARPGRPPRTWPDHIALVLMTPIFLLGVSGLLTAKFGSATKAIGNEFGAVGVVMLVIAYLLAGLVCTGFSRLVPMTASTGLADLVAVAGFLLGCVAAVLAADGCAQFMLTVDPTERENAWRTALLVVFLTVCTTAGFAWNSRKRRGRTAARTQ